VSLGVAGYTDACNCCAGLHRWRQDTVAWTHSTRTKAQAEPAASNTALSMILQPPLNGAEDGQTHAQWRGGRRRWGV